MTLKKNVIASVFVLVLWLVVSTFALLPNQVSAVAIGDSYEGGVVAYILQSNDPGYESLQEQGLIVAPSDQSTGAPWGCYGTVITGADGTAVGTGNQNTIDIMAGCATAGIAARLAGDLVLDVYDDWYLPSRDELTKIYPNRNNLGSANFSSVTYWSSSEVNTANLYDAFIYYFNGGNYSTRSKSVSFNTYVRAVRSFSIVVSDLNAYNFALSAATEEDYTPESWVIYQDIVSENEVTKYDSQNEVDTATANIINAQSGLVDIASPTFGAHIGTTGTPGETTTIRVTVNDNVSVDRADISFDNGDNYESMIETPASITRNQATQRRYTYELDIPVDQATDIDYIIRAYDVADNNPATLEDSIFINRWTKQLTTDGLSLSQFASSSDGSKIVAVSNNDNYVYTSTNSGVNWTKQLTTEGLALYGFTSSSDGSKIVAVSDTDGYVYTSTNSGVNWTKQLTTEGLALCQFASSSDGSKIVACSNSDGYYVYTSTNSGVNWTKQLTTEGLALCQFASSSDGSKIVTSSNNDGYVYTSTNSGVNWTKQLNTDGLSLNDFASSSDGSKIVAGSGMGGYVYTSINSGVNWTKQLNTEGLALGQFASSSDGSKIVAGSNNDGYVYTSINSGVNWTKQLSTDGLSLYDFASSSDGSKIVAYSGSDGYVYTYYSGLSSPTLTTDPVTSITATGATFNATITDKGGEDPTSVGFKYGKTETHGTDVGGGGDEDFATFSSIMTNLTCNTTYYVEAFAENSTEETAFGGDVTFTTSACPAEHRSRVIGSSGGSVRQFQTEQQVPPTPPVTPPATPVLTPTPSITTGIPLNLTRTLKLNMTGDDVKVLQVYLNTHGFILALTGPGSKDHETNKFGPLTKKAVIAFQKANGLIGDGIVGPLTLAKMK